MTQLSTFSAIAGLHSIASVCWLCLLITKANFFALVCSSFLAAHCSEIPKQPENLLLFSPYSLQGGSKMMQDSSSNCSPSAPFTASNSQQQRAPVTPQLWTRELSRSGTVYYRTPSGRLLLHRDDLERYLAERASCRCGIRPGAEYVFNFSPEVAEEKRQLDAFAEVKNCSADAQASTSQVSTPQTSTSQTSTPQAPTSHVQTLQAQTPPTSPSQAQNTSPSATKRRSSEVVVEEEEGKQKVENAETVKAAENDAQVEEVAGKQEEEGTKLEMANQSANWAPLVEADPTLLEWYCYSWTANLPTADYHSLLRDLLDELADDSTTDLVEMYCILEGLPRKDLPVHPFPDDNFQAWLSQHDWGRLAVRRTTGHILPRQLSPHQLTHLLATTMLEEELEAQEERLQMVQTRQWAAAQRLKQLEVELKSRQQQQMQQTEPENLKVDAEVLETDGDSEEEEEVEVEELEDEDLTEESSDDEEEAGGGSDDSSEHESFVAVV